MKKYIVSIGVDISDNDVKTNPKVNELVNKEIKKDYLN